MRVEQIVWTRDGASAAERAVNLAQSAQLVFAFGKTDCVRDSAHFLSIRKAYPNAKIIGCSTAGEIHEHEVLSDAMVVTACCFERTPLRQVTVELSQCADSYDAGRRLCALLPRAELAHVFVISEGVKINGSDLVRGLTKYLPPGVSVTGGLAGDGGRFEETLIYADAPARSGIITAVGFYGRYIRVGYGSQGGWDPFGPVRRITKSKGNVLLELDSQSALSLYKRYLGEHAANLPASGLLFPLHLQGDENSTPVVRTLLAVEERGQSMTFAGDVAQGSFVQFMHANCDGLTGGARGAAEAACHGPAEGKVQLALLISCVGRKLVLKDRVAEEVDAVRQILGPQVATAGFYSYGEICPFTHSGKCELHNQTMTVTTLGEE